MCSDSSQQISKIKPKTVHQVDEEPHLYFLGIYSSYCNDLQLSSMEIIRTDTAVSRHDRSGSSMPIDEPLAVLKLDVSTLKSRKDVYKMLTNV